MDGRSGEPHPELGAKIMAVFGKEWHDLSLYHSRFYAKKHGQQYSRLCVADKYAICLTPRWLYLFLCQLSGEINEYLVLAGSKTSKYTTMNLPTETAMTWHGEMCRYLNGWVIAHKDLKDDTWTPSTQ